MGQRRVQQLLFSAPLESNLRGVHVSTVLKLVELVPKFSPIYPSPVRVSTVSVVVGIIQA